MLFRPNVVCCSAVVLATVLLMLSCASSTPAERLTVHVPEPHDTLVTHVNLCISGAPGKDIYVDEHGVGKSSLCPVANQTVTVEIVEGPRHYAVPSEEIQIRRTGDGIATSVEARLHD